MRTRTRSGSHNEKIKTNVAISPSEGVIQNALKSDKITFRITNSDTLSNILYMSIAYQVEIEPETLIGFVHSKYIDLFVKCFNRVNQIGSNIYPANVYKKHFGKNHYKFYGNEYCIFDLIGNKIIFDAWKIKCYTKSLE
jgi:hypothetical protein